MYFTLKELCRSKKAQDFGIDNFPTFEIVANLSRLVSDVLDPLRSAWGSAINVTSGYRCPTLNALVGGTMSSAHLSGYAADLYPANGQFDRFVTFTKTWVMAHGIKFDQLIIERDQEGKRWLHIGLFNSKGQQRGQIFNLEK